MIILDIRFGRFSVLASQGMDPHKHFGFGREPGEVIFDSPLVSLYFINHRKAHPALEP